MLVYSVVVEIFNNLENPKDSVWFVHLTLLNILFNPHLLKQEILNNFVRNSLVPQISGVTGNAWVGDCVLRTVRQVNDSPNVRFIFRVFRELVDVDESNIKRGTDTLQAVYEIL